MKMKIHREGKNILLILFIILALLNLPVYLWIKITWLAYLIHAASIIFFFLVVNFFRSPKRHFKGNPKNAIVAPADGVVVVLEEVLEDEYFHDKRMQVSIFMNIFNVHANWFPVAGKVIHVSHQQGRFMAAYLPKSSTDNERSTVVIKAENGEEILVRQVHHQVRLYRVRRCAGHHQGQGLQVLHPGRPHRVHQRHDGAGGEEGPHLGHRAGDRQDRAAVQARLPHQ